MIKLKCKKIKQLSFVYILLILIDASFTLHVVIMKLATESPNNFQHHKGKLNIPAQVVIDLLQ